MPKKGEGNRRRIVEAANRLFYERGFHRTALADIAAASQIPKGNFYFYFRTKDEILDAVVDSRCERLRARLDDWERKRPDPIDRLRRMSEIVVRDWAEVVRYGCPMGTLVLELGKQEADLKVHAVRMFEMLVDWAETQFAKVLDRKAARRHARQLLVRMQGAAVLASALGDKSWLFDEQRAIADWLDRLRPDR